MNENYNTIDTTPTHEGKTWTLKKFALPLIVALAFLSWWVASSCSTDEPNNPNNTEQPVDNETQYINKIKSWIERLKQLTFQVDKPINLLQWLYSPEVYINS